MAFTDFIHLLLRLEKLLSALNYYLLFLYEIQIKVTLVKVKKERRTKMAA